MAIQTTEDAGNRTGGEILYLSMNKDGGYWYNKKKDLKVQSVTGKITAIKTRISEWQGKKTVKAQIWLEDEHDEQYSRLSVEFGLKAWFALRLFQRLVTVDFSKPVQIGILKGDARNGGNAPIYVWMNQDETKVEPDASAVPQPEKVKVGSEEVLNWEPFTNWFDKYVQSLRGVLPNQVVALDGRPENTNVGSDVEVDADPDF